MRGRLVEHEHRLVGEHRPRQRRAGPVRRPRRPPPSPSRVCESVRQPVEPVTEACAPQRDLDLVVGGVRPSQADVLDDRRREHVRIVVDQADRAADLVERDSRARRPRRSVTRPVRGSMKRINSAAKSTCPHPDGPTTCELGPRRPGAGRRPRHDGRRAPQPARQPRRAASVAAIGSAGSPTGRAIADGGSGRSARRAGPSQRAPARRPTPASGSATSASASPSGTSTIRAATDGDTASRRPGRPRTATATADTPSPTWTRTAARHVAAATATAGPRAATRAADRRRSSRAAALTSACQATRCSSDLRRTRSPRRTAHARSATKVRSASLPPPGQHEADATPPGVRAPMARSGRRDQTSRPARAATRPTDAASRPGPHPQPLVDVRVDVIDDRGQHVSAARTECTWGERDQRRRTPGSTHPPGSAARHRARRSRSAYRSTGRAMPKVRTATIATSRVSTGGCSDARTISHPAVAVRATPAARRDSRA